jgi:dUTP pyrophosphatase
MDNFMPFDEGGHPKNEGLTQSYINTMMAKADPFPPPHKGFPCVAPKPNPRLTNMEQYKAVKKASMTIATTPMVKVVRTSNCARLPQYGSMGAGGADLFALLDHPVNIEPGARLLVPTGLSMEIPTGHVGLIRPRSGLSKSQGIEAFGGVIDSDYRGDIGVLLRNIGAQVAYVQPYDRIAQIVIVPVLTPVYIDSENISGTERGEGGWGSTGK